MPSNTTAQHSSKTSHEFPTWDGSKETIPDFLFGINVMKNDNFFSMVRFWNTFTPGDEPQNNYLLTLITAKVPLNHRSIFANDIRYTADGFAMLDPLITQLKGKSTENKLIAVAELYYVHVLH